LFVQILDKDWVAKSEPNRPVWKGKKPNRTEINRFEPVFGLVRFKNLKKKLVWLFILVQNRTEPKMLSPNLKKLISQLKNLLDWLKKQNKKNPFQP
jgi:hypothetical protein